MGQKVATQKKTTKGRTVSNLGLAARVAEVENQFLRNDMPVYRPGDTVRVHVRIKEGDKERVQVFEGVVIGRSNEGARRSFTVRKVSHGVGVERTFLESSPKVAKLEVITPGKVRRAKLYYLRGLEGRAAKIERDITSTRGRTPAAGGKASAKAAAKGE